LNIAGSSGGRQGGYIALPEPERKVVSMDVYNMGWTCTVCYYVVCNGYIGGYLLKTQIKAATLILTD